MTYRIVEIAFPTGKIIQIMENKTLYKYLDLARELKNLWNKRVRVTLIVIGALVTVSKGLERERDYLEIRGRIKAIQTTILWRSG